MDTLSQNGDGNCTGYYGGDRLGVVSNHRGLATMVPQWYHELPQFTTMINHNDIVVYCGLLRQCDRGKYTPRFATVWLPYTTICHSLASIYHDAPQYGSIQCVQFIYIMLFINSVYLVFIQLLFSLLVPSNSVYINYY
jgi:hypothetical protein